ncbi:MAG: AAA family ATPase [Rhodospirillales bacterium]|nr:AAA family ATPase [Rhodospirillales bacterium]
MKDYDQSRVIEFLGRADSYGDGGEPVKKIETHISVVFLVGPRAFKLKRTVKYPYLDFSTLELRRQTCVAEVSVNRRTAPDLYKGVVAVTRSDDDVFSIAGDGEVVEWLVEMERFDEDTLFDQLSLNGKLTPHLMGDLAEAIAEFHMAAEPRPQDDSVQGLEETISGNAASFSLFGADIFDSAAVQAVTEAQVAALHGACGEKLKARGKAGLVRHCHGDLHLRNICLTGGRPTLFDAIEFNDTFAHIDVFYDLAFLLMDLDHRGQRRLANIVLNRYLDITGDTDGLQCLPLLLSVRAAIRAHVNATAASQQSSPVETLRLAGEARAYLDLARDYLMPGKPRLIAVGGLSGSGKSRLGRELARYIGLAPGARIIRSDVIRKRLAGVTPLTRLEENGYSPEMTRRTYHEVYEQVRSALKGGHSVIADAVFANPEERKAIAALASKMGLAFDGLWLEAPADEMEARVTQRKFNASDADAAVVRQQLSYDLGNIEWSRVDSAGTKSLTLENGLNALGLSVVTEVQKSA